MDGEGACTEHFQNTTCGGIQVKCWHQNSSRLVGKDGGQGSEIRVNNDKRDLGLAGRRCIKRRPSLSCNLHQMHTLVHFGSAWLIIIRLNRFFSFVDSFAYYVCVCCGNFSH